MRVKLQPFAALPQNAKTGSLLPFAAAAKQKKLADALSVRFLRAAFLISHP